MNQKGEADFPITLLLLGLLLFSLFWGSIKIGKKGYNADCSGLFEVTVNEIKNNE